MGGNRRLLSAIDLWPQVRGDLPRHVAARAERRRAQAQMGKPRIFCGVYTGATLAARAPRRLDLLAASQFHTTTRSARPRRATRTGADATACCSSATSRIRHSQGAASLPRRAASAARSRMRQPAASLHGRRRPRQHVAEGRSAPSDVSVLAAYQLARHARTHGGLQVRAIWKWIYRKVLNDYDYFYIAGDDAILIVENLRKYLVRGRAASLT
jgi:hypothetical protein